MKTLVAYYSRTGNTKKIAEKIAEKLQAETDEIVDLKDRNGIVGWLGGGRDAFFKKSTKIETKKNPKEYDMVIIGTPVWMGTATPAVKKYLKKYTFQKVAFFCTFGGDQKNIFKEMETLSNKPVATIGLKDKDIENKESREKTEKFCTELQ